MSLDKHPKTLGDWREIAVIALGEDSPAIQFLDEKIAAQGENMRVVAHWSQMLMLLEKIHGGQKCESD